MTTFAAELRRAMDARGVLVKELARQVGIRPEALSRIRFGHSKPTHACAVALADALSWEPLTVISEKMHRGTCIVCGRYFIDPTTNGNRRYCSKRCQTTANIRHARNRQANRLHLEARRWREATQIIARFCEGCEPADRLCRDSTCALRPLSPFPFVPLTGTRTLRRIDPSRDAA